MGKNYLINEIIKNDCQKSPFRLIFLIFAFLFLFNIILFIYLRYRTPNLGYEVVTRKWNLLEKLEEKKDWLILGDSTCNQGLSVDVFEKENDVTAINLCTIGDMLTVNDSWMLEKYIKKVGPPKNVLIIHTYNIWEREKADLGLFSQTPVLSLIKEESTPWIFGKKEVMLLLFYKYFPIYSEKSSILETIVGFFQKEDPRKHVVFDEKGFMAVEYPDPETVNISVNSHKNSLKNSRFQMSSFNLSGIENIKKLAEKYEFDVFIANSPINSELAKDENFKAYFSDLNSYLDEYASRSDHLHHINSLFPFPASEMASSDHVTKSAATKYSKKISEEIRKIRLSKKEKYDLIYAKP